MFVNSLFMTMKVAKLFDVPVRTAPVLIPQAEGLILHLVDLSFPVDQHVSPGCFLGNGLHPVDGLQPKAFDEACSGEVFQDLRGNDDRKDTVIFQQSVCSSNENREG